MVLFGANQPGSWSRKAERTGKKSVGDSKGQAGNVDPGMEALRGESVTGERKVVPRIGLRTEQSWRRVRVR